jgi:hypothetical protein
MSEHAINPSQQQMIPMFMQWTTLQFLMALEDVKSILFVDD